MIELIAGAADSCGGKPAAPKPSRQGKENRSSIRGPSKTGGASIRSLRILFLIAASALLGCQTARSWSEGCPGVYSGVRYFQDHVSELPIDGRIFFILDLPVSAGADTALLPATVFIRPTRPRDGFLPGCRWAKKR